MINVEAHATAHCRMARINDEIFFEKEAESRCVASFYTRAVEALSGVYRTVYFE